MRKVFDLIYNPISTYFKIPGKGYVNRLCLCLSGVRSVFSIPTKWLYDSKLRNWENSERRFEMTLTTGRPGRDYHQYARLRTFNGLALDPVTYSGPTWFYKPINPDYYCDGDWLHEEHDIPKGYMDFIPQQSRFFSKQFPGATDLYMKLEYIGAIK